MKCSSSATPVPPDAPQPPVAVRRAVIDIGTNSVKVLVADVSGRQVVPVWEESHQTRLGRGLYKENRLQARPIAETARAVAEFAELARGRRATSIRVIATSAVRDAVNKSEFLDAIERASQFQVEIISGEQEADMGFEGVTTDPALADGPILLVDPGGGSAEFILGCGRQKHFSKSYPLGTVRLMEHLPHSDPPRPEELAACRNWLAAFFRAEVRPQLEPALRREQRLVRLVGVGGTASILARMEANLDHYDRERMEAARLSRKKVGARVEQLWSLPLEQRKKIVGLPPDRADVILPGLTIYEAIMTELGFEELRVSTRGLRFAAVLGGG